MRLRHLIPLAAILYAPLAAHADTYNIFDVKASVAGIGPVTGTVTFDVTTNLFTDSNLTLTFPPGFFFSSLNFTGPGGAPRHVGTYTPGGTFEIAEFYADAAHNNEFILSVATAFLDGTGGAICSVSNSCIASGANENSNFSSTAGGGPVSSGSISPHINPAVTPEPSSLILLGTGLIGAFGAMRRRHIRSS